VLYTPTVGADRRQIITAIINIESSVKKPMAVTVSCSNKPISATLVDFVDGVDGVRAKQINTYTVVRNV